MGPEEEIYPIQDARFPRRIRTYENCELLEVHLEVQDGLVVPDADFRYHLVPALRTYLRY